MNQYENIFRRLVKSAVNGEPEKPKPVRRRKRGTPLCKGGKRGIKTTPTRYVRKFVKLMGITSNVDECWEWKGATRVRNYGGMRFKRKTWMAHRLALLFSGRDPAGKCACHHCDNPKCVNPRHLFIGTMKDNTLDMINKGRHNPQRGEANGWSTTKLETVLSIRKDFAAGGVTQQQLADKYGVTHNVAHFIVRRRSWKHV